MRFFKCILNYLYIFQKRCKIGMCSYDGILACCCQITLRTEWRKEFLCDLENGVQRATADGVGYFYGYCWRVDLVFWSRRRSHEVMIDG